MQTRASARVLFPAPVAAALAAAPPPPRAHIASYCAARRAGDSASLPDSLPNELARMRSQGFAVGARTRDSVQS